MTVKTKATALFLLFVLSAVNLTAQTTTTPESDRSYWPGWLRDLRRWEIVAFGSFPFTMFFSTIGMNTYRWQRETGMDFSSEGRRYAPWPLTSAGAIPMEDSEQRRTIMIAIGLSAGVAVADHLIVQARRRRERRRAEAIPVGTVIIIRTPIEGPYEEQHDAIDAQAYDDEPVADMEDAETAIP